MENQQVRTLHKIPNYDGYFCDADGNIFSNKAKGGSLRKLTPHRHKGRGKKLYLRIRLSKDLLLVHRVVASAKYGRPLTTDEHVNHINAMTEDNRFLNLEVVSHKENVEHAVVNRLYCNGKDWYLARGLNFND